jgi:CRISPR-associated protein Cas2
MGITQVLLVYDITDDRKRAKVADACKDYGLDRLQFSAFSGELTRNLQEELIMKIEALLDDSPHNVQLISIPLRDWEARRELIHA